MLLIPAIDLRAGRCVRLAQGNFTAETAYEIDPEALLARYEALGVPWVHVVDLERVRAGSTDNRRLIISLARQRPIRFQVGGGVRSAGSIAELLDSGIARVVLGSLAIERPEEVTHWLKRFGPEHICLAFDVRMDAEGEPYVRTRGWTHESGVHLWDALAPYADSAVHVLCTDISRDGTLAGPNLDLYANALKRFPAIRWQASGGVRDVRDLAALSATGVAAAITGKALLEARITQEEYQAFLPDASSPASTSATARS